MWPQYILDEFARIPAHSILGNKYYGVYNSILTRECFNSIQFSVKPLYPLSNAEDPYLPDIDTMITYVVAVDNLPVFFLEICSPCHMDNMLSRVRVDKHMRHRYRYLYDLFPTPKLHGISIMGQRLAFYCQDKTTGYVTPEYVAWSYSRMVDTVPKTRWDVDITTEEGYQRFMAVVQDVKEMAHAL